MTTVSQAVEKRQEGPVTIMWSRRAHFAAVLPASVDVEAFLGTAAGALYGNRDLMDAARSNPDSLIVVLMRCAALGHLPGTDEFYIYNRKRKGRPEVAGTEGYRGIIERMYRSGAVAKVVVREVCARDYFRYSEGDDERPAHRFAAREGTTGADFFGDKGSAGRGPMVGVYAIAQLTTGAWSRPAILTRDDVMAAKESSDARDSEFSPWNRMDGGKDHPEFQGRSMWWKTAARRLEPWVPTSREYRREQLAASARATALAAPPAPPAVTAAPAPDIVDAEIVEETAAEPPGPSRPASTSPGTARGRQAQRQPQSSPAPAAASQEPPAADLAGQVSDHFTRLGVTDEGERLGWAAQLAGLAHAIDGLGDLDAAQQQAVADALSRCQAFGDVVSLIEDGSVTTGEGAAQ